MSWVVKNRYTGRLFHLCDSQDEAQQKADSYNTNYQSDTYYVEEFDTQKNRWFPDGN